MMRFIHLFQVDNYLWGKVYQKNGSLNKVSAKKPVVTDNQTGQL